MGIYGLRKKFGTVIEQSLNYRVLKCGVPAYGTYQESIKIHKIIKKVQNSPRLIIVGYYIGNDLVNDYLFPESTVYKGNLAAKVVLNNIETGEKYTRPTQDISEKGEDCFDPVLKERTERVKKYGTETELTGGMKEKIKYWLKQHSKLYYLMSQNSLCRTIAEKIGMVSPSRAVFNPYYPIDKLPWLRQAWKMHLENLSTIKEIADLYNSRLLIVLIPDRITKCLENRDWDLEQPYRLVKKYLDSKDIDYLDLSPDFTAYRKKNKYSKNNDLYSKWDFNCHFSETGEQYAGLLISQYILENNLIYVDNADQKQAEIKRRIAQVLSQISC